MNSDPPIPVRRRRRLIVLLVLCLAGIGVVLWTGALARIPQQLATKALSAHRIDEAEGHLAWARWLATNNGETEFLLARVRRKQGQVDEMMDHLETAARLGVDPERIRREQLLAMAQAGQLQGRYDAIDALLLDPRDDGREILDAYVNGLLRNANYQAAGYLIDSWSKEFPEDAQPHYISGRIQRHLRNFESAEEKFRTALDKQPDHFAAAYQLADLLLQQKQPAEAIPVAKTALAMKYNAAPTLVLARSLRAQGDVDAARRLLEELASRPSEEIARSYQRVGQPLVGAPVAAELGTLELDSGRYKEALKWLTEAVEADPDNLDTRYSWAIALRQSGEVERSVEELKRVVDAREALTEVDRLADGLDPFKPHIEERFRIGELYMQHGSKRTAEFWLKSVLHFDPDHAEAHRLLAEYYELRASEEPEYAVLAREHRAKAGSE
ncbi:tetratricopeptide repeat protein [Maioricimonas sp. JC845]|uniref:tetratricopeptide repeat protein n=1 Tax=Maioricimonas sp. JC845 TaxID=3232138 RepID=UPI003459D476